MSRRTVKANKGEKYNNFTVIKEAEPHESNKNNQRQRRVKCRCACGVVKTVLLGNLRNGNSRSCGCAIRRPRGPDHKNYKHGEAYTPLHCEWANLLRYLRGLDLEPDGQLKEYRNYKAFAEKKPEGMLRLVLKKKTNGPVGFRHLTWTNGKRMKHLYYVNGVLFRSMAEIARAEGVSRQRIDQKFRKKVKGYVKVSLRYGK